ncbi:MAG: hypothetical protein ACRDKE_07305 [Solirubrobacterales bacterium]
MKSIRICILLMLVVVATGVTASTAGAAPVFRYSASMDDGAYSSPGGGNIGINRLDATKSTRVIVSPPIGPNRFDSGTIAAANNYYNSPFVTNLSPGDTITVRQPAVSVAPTETFVVPSFVVNITVGSNVLTGTLPAGLRGALVPEYRCNNDPTPTALTAGPFSVPTSTILPGEKVQLNSATADGDSFYYASHAPGESPCIEINARPASPPPTGESPNPTPYRISAENMNVNVAASTRVVLRRGTTILFDTSEDDPNVNASLAVQPLPGDTVDVYRPKTAPTPMHSKTIPPLSAVFDPAVDLVAVDSPAAGLINSGPCRAYSCATENFRARLNAPAGRTLLNFAVAEGVNGPIDLRPDDRLGVTFADPDFTLSYTFQGSVGDLVAPKQSIKLSSTVKRKSLTKAFKKGYKVKVKSNEAGPANLTLAFPKAKAGKAVTLAKASKSVVAGTTTVTLKFTKAGKKALQKLRKRSSRLATLTSTVTDASGNTSTLVKRTKIKA